MEILLGNDEEGVPDVFAFQDGRLQYCIEVTSYTFTKIHELRPIRFDGTRATIDLAECTDVHRRQVAPATVVQKKILGGRKYSRFDSEALILLIHSDVMVKDGALCFPMTGPMSMSTSCNNFFHHRDEILWGLRAVCTNSRAVQWDQIWLADYSDNLVPSACPNHEIWPR